MQSKLTFGSALGLWWGSLWRALLYTVLISVTAGLVIGTIGWLLGVPLVWVRKLGFVAGVLSSLAATLLGLKRSVEKFLSQRPTAASST
ncbi:hypothetical protein D9M68_700610 [compost metagenome]